MQASKQASNTYLAWQHILPLVSQICFMNKLKNAAKISIYIVRTPVITAETEVKNMK